ncbi:MAG: type I-E CRISPR-associated protein Cas5/CasD [Methanocalculus sp.]|uniref:type I-E CRISPR-associated protein Cas5/CasD n=1 Tax=Methanocalculus sp. TaxID=2004547 RepID=UPI002716EA9F|nr:type I-E CRISPR-associated protein Cas5/CasD [Methanocalculus sp.]MDO9538582.1 type I-E CRISPR-associated protein Cas5/CasD [Methanocalculus sp.]
MTRFLLFQLYGPLASWGETAVGEIRSTATHPTKSAIMGLLSAAKGIRSDEEELLGRMSAEYGVAVLEKGSNISLRDFHTAQTPMTSAEKTVGRYASRRHELMVTHPDKNLNTVISWRDYVSDGVYYVAIWEKNSTPPFTLDNLKESLIHPTFVLYLGRRSCPLALPLTPIIQDAEDPVGALCSAKFPKEHNVDKIGKKRRSYSIFFEGEWKSISGNPSHTEYRYDRLISRKRWQYGSRTERRIMVSKNEEGELCI